MISNGLPTAMSANVIDCGNPWHGIAEGGVLDYGGAENRLWTTPDSGDCFLIQVPGAPGSVQETSLNPDHQWLEYGLLSGWWQRQLYGQPLPGGRLSWVFSAGLGNTYIVDASALDFTDPATHFGGDLVLQSTRCSSSPPAADSQFGMVALPSGAGTGHWDIVAINQDGSEALIGLWSAATTYTEANNNRGAASQDVYRPTPDTLLKINASGSITVWKTLAQMVAGSSSSSSTSGSIFYFSATIEVGGTTTSGPSNECHYEDYTLTSEYGTAYPSGADEIYPCEFDTTTANTAADERIIVGAYYKADGSLALVELVKSYTYDQDVTCDSFTVAGPFNWTYGSIWNGTDCGTYGEWLAYDLSGAQYHRTTARQIDTSIALYVDGVKKSEVIIASDFELVENVIATVGGGITVSLTKSTGLTADGTALGTIPDEVSTNPTSMGTKAAYISLLDIRVHAVRYSNHAYGLMLCNLPSADFSGTAYLLGIVNVITGTQDTAAGFLTTPDDTIEYPYMQRSVTVHPVSGAISQSMSGTNCFV